jgi:hypothetical protein
MWATKQDEEGGSRHALAHGGSTSLCSKNARKGSGQPKMVQVRGKLGSMLF